MTLTNVEVLAMDAAGGTTASFKASQLNGKTYTITGNATADKIVVGAATGLVDSTTIDLSKLVLDTTNVTKADVTVTAAGHLSDAIAVGATLTITGTAVIDTVNVSSMTGGQVISTLGGADVITGGSGADTITGGEGADVITGGAGNDTIILTETVAAIDTVVFSTHGTNGIDTITGFGTIDLLNVALLGDGVIGTAGTAVTAAATQRTLTDNTSVVITATGAAASITTSGTKAITDFTNLTQVAEFLAEGFLAATGADTEANVFVFNVSGTNSTYVYSFDSADANQIIAAAELKLVGVIDNGGTALANANVVYA